MRQFICPSVCLFIRPSLSSETPTSFGSLVHPFIHHPPIHESIDPLIQPPPIRPLILHSSVRLGKRPSICPSSLLFHLSALWQVGVTSRSNEKHSGHSKPDPSPCWITTFSVVKARKTIAAALTWAFNQFLTLSPAAETEVLCFLPRLFNLIQKR